MQRIYSQLPPVLRSLVGTGYGYYVRRWRYGSNFEHLVETALARDSWNSQEWQHWQEEQLSRLLQRAMRNVPFYRHYWESQPNRDWRVLANWPILEKEQLRCAAGQFLANDCSARRLFQDYTSGTTGTPLRFLASRDTLRRWYALFEARSRRWYGVSRQNRWAILGGKLVKPVHEQNPPFWIWNCALNQLYMSCYHLSPSHISQYLDALKTYRIQYLYGYSSALYELALEVVRQGRIDLQMTVSIKNAEPLLPAQREIISMAFSAPVM